MSPTRPSVAATIRLAHSFELTIVSFVYLPMWPARFGGSCARHWPCRLDVSPPRSCCEEHEDEQGHEQADRRRTPDLHIPAGEAIDGDIAQRRRQARTETEHNAHPEEAAVRRERHQREWQR